MLGLALPSFGVEQDYVDRAILTGEQGNEVIALAQECEIGKVDRASIVSAVDLLLAFYEIAGVHFQHRISLMEPGGDSQRQGHSTARKTAFLEDGGPMAGPENQARPLGILCGGQRELETGGEPGCQTCRTL